MVVVLATACGSTMEVGTNGESVGSDDGETETDDAAGFPAPNCDQLPDLDSPLREWIEADGVNLPTHVLPGGDFLRVDTDQLTRMDADLQPLWSVETGTDTFIGDVVPTASDEIVVTGHVYIGGERSLWLARYDHEGHRTHERIVNGGLGSGGLLGTTAGTPTGALRLDIWLGLDEPSALDSYDESFERQWRREFEDLTLALGTSADGTTYQVSVSDGGQPNPEISLYDWNIQLLAIGPEGEELWSAEAVLEGVNNLPVHRVTAGEQIYVMAGGPFLSRGSAVFAFRHDGTPAWTFNTRELEGSVSVHEIAASPCGGVYVGGTSTGDNHLDPRVTIWHIDASGSPESYVRLSADGLEDGYRYTGIERIQVTPVNELVVWGKLAHRSDSENSIDWMRTY